MARPIYPFNPNGNLPDGVVIGEEQVLTPQNGVNYTTIIPRCAPFFNDGITIKVKDTGRVLEINKDYTLGYFFNEFTILTYKGLYGCITFLNVNTPTTVVLEYSTLGWNFVQDEISYMNLVANIISNPPTVQWDNIADKPDTYPPFEHSHDAADVTKWIDFIATFQALVNSMTSSDSGAMQQLLLHVQNIDNPHQTTKAQVGLGNVNNYKTATTDAELMGAGDDLYTSVASAKRLLTLFRYPVPMVKSLTDASRSDDLVEATTEINIIRTLAEGYNLLTPDEATNYLQWQQWLNYLVVDESKWADTGKPIPSKPPKNGVHTRLLGE